MPSAGSGIASELSLSPGITWAEAKAAGLVIVVYILLLLAIAFFVPGCSKPPAPAPQIVRVTTSQGTFKLVRPEGRPDASDAFEIALWAKEGENSGVYLRTQAGFFTRIEP